MIIIIPLQIFDSQGFDIAQKSKKLKTQVTSKNMQGQFHVDDILTHPLSTIKLGFQRNVGDIISIQIPGDRGLRYTLDGKLIRWSLFYF